MKDHEVDIRAAAEGELDELARLVDEDEDGSIFSVLDVWALEVDVMKSTIHEDRWRVEFLTGVGGPTTCWTVDSRDAATAVFNHSWGYPTREVEVWGSLAEQLCELARELAEDLS